MKYQNLRILMLSSLMLSAVSVATSSIALADCEVVSNGKRMPFKGEDMQYQNLSVEKKSLLKLDREYPSLNIVEKTFKGEITTCSNCTDNFLVCSN